MSRIHIIDGHSQVFRAFHAIRGGLSNADGLPTNAIFGFFTSLNAFIKSEQPTHLVVTFDAGHDARSEMYPDYKSNRGETPEELLEQFPHIFRLLDAMGVTRVQVQGEEADDVIATLTREGLERGDEVVVLSNDKDLLQLVNDRVTVMRTRPNSGMVRCDDAAVMDQMGVRPDQVVDLLALMGDSVDCIPGVQGVGPKTATKLLAEHSDLEGVLAAAPEMKKSKVRDNLIEQAEQARLSQRLATLDDHVELPVKGRDALAFNFQPNPELTEILRELDLRVLLDEWGEEVVTPAVETETEIILTAAELKAFVKRAKKAPMIAFDTETTGVDAMRDTLVGISLSLDAGTGAYIPVAHVELGAIPIAQLSVEEVQEILGPILADPAIPKCGHHLKFDLKVLRRAGFEVKGLAFDTMVASTCLKPDSRGHGLKDLSQERLGVVQTPIEELIGSGKDQISMAEVELEKAAAYAAQDADLTLRLWQLFEPELKEAGLIDLFRDIEMPLVEILADMEMEGVALDRAHFAAMKADFQKRLTALTTEIHEIAGKPFNINSTQQLRTILFEELELPVIKKTKTGPSTDVSVLEQLANEHPLPRKILEFRSIEKLLSTYIEPLPALVHPETGRIHTNYSQTGAATGRFSSSDPNLQNIPVRTEDGRRIREGFIPSAKGHVFLAADYSQIELRVAAHLSGDATMIEAFRQGEDIHRATAAKVHGIEPSEVTAAQRDAAKRVSFGILYGISAHRLSMDLQIPRAEAQAMIDQHFETFTGVRQWIEGTLEQAREKGYVTTLFGRRRHVPDIHSKNFNLRSASERVAVNTPVQGSAADLIKIAMRDVARWLNESDLQAKMVLQVHDELIFDLPEGEVDTVRPAVEERMAGAMALDVPIVVDTAVGANWAACKG